MKDTSNHYILMLKLGVETLDNKKTINFNEMLQYFESHYDVDRYHFQAGELFLRNSMSLERRFIFKEREELERQ